MTSNAPTPPAELRAHIEGEFGVPLQCPAYRGLGNWLSSARTKRAPGETLICLVPARTDTRWWWDHCRHGEVRFLRGRLRFEGEPSSAPFPSAVVIFGWGAREGETLWWDWRNGRAPEGPALLANTAVTGVCSA